MANFYPQGSGINWQDDRQVQAARDNYRAWALEIVNDNINKLFLPGNVKHPWRNDYDKACKINIFELEGDHFQGPHQFNDAMEMIRFFENTPKDGSERRTNRRIILLEDMVPQIIELLGVTLGIPPQFFLAHCDQLSDLRVIDETFAVQNSTYWRVPVPTSRYVPPTVPSGVYSIDAGNFSREEIDYRSVGGRQIYFNSYVSYWGQSYGSDSWTAVILLDPHQMWLRGPSNVSHRLETPNFATDSMHEIMISGNATSRGIIQSSQRNMFDAAVTAHREHPILNTHDPFTGTVYVRNLIRSAWDNAILRDAAAFHDLLVQDGKLYKTHQDGTDTGKAADEEYLRFLVLRQSIQAAKEHISSIMWKFRLMDVADSSQAKDLVTMPGQPEDTGVRKYLAEEAQRQMYLSEEKRVWKMIYDTQCSLESKVAEQMEMWSLRAARAQTAEAQRQAEEAQKQTAEANRMARTSGQLTKIATIIVPCTFVGSIFSMGGRFAAGEDLFYVYWAITVPVTVVLLAWVLHHDIHSTSHPQKMKEIYKMYQERQSARQEAGITEKMAGQSTTLPQAEAGDGISVKQRRQGGEQIV